MSKQPLMIEWLKTKNFIQKSTLKKQAPPGPAPRPGLKWKPSTHRWIIDQSADVSRGSAFPSDHPVHANPDKPYLSSNKFGLGFDLHEGDEILYEGYPHGRRITGSLQYDDEEGWIIQTTGDWARHFDDVGVSDYVKLGGDEGMGVVTNLTEFKKVKEDVSELVDMIGQFQKNIALRESPGQNKGILLKPFVFHNHLEESLASIEKKIGYNSHESVHESGDGGQTPLQIIVDQVYGALEGQSSRGGPYAGSWEDTKSEIKDYLVDNEPEKAPLPDHA